MYSFRKRNKTSCVCVCVRLTDLNMLVNTKLISVCVAALCVQTCLSAKLAVGNDTKEEESAIASKSKRNYDAYRHGQENNRFGQEHPRIGQEHHRFGPAPVRVLQPHHSFPQELSGYARGLGYDDGSAEEPHHRSQATGNEQESIQQYSQRDPESDGYDGQGHDGGNNERERISAHESDIMAAQDTMNLYYDDLLRLQGLMANMVTDPHADEGGDYSDY